MFDCPVKNNKRMILFQTISIQCKREKMKMKVLIIVVFKMNNTNRALMLMSYWNDIGTILSKRKRVKQDVSKIIMIEKIQHSSFLLQ